jgi:hypothetical protein
MMVVRTGIVPSTRTGAGSSLLETCLMIPSERARFWKFLEDVLSALQYPQFNQSVALAFATFICHNLTPSNCLSKRYPR